MIIFTNLWEPYTLLKAYALHLDVNPGTYNYYICNTNVQIFIFEYA